jgi:flagellin
MANSILTNNAAMSAQRFLSAAGDKAASSIAKMSSGSRIVKASDDASSLAISNKLRADIATLKQASSNASQGSSLLQVANGGLAQIGDILTRMKTLSTQVVNGTLSSAERQFAQQEFSNLVTQVGETASQTQVNGIAVLNGADKVLGETNKRAAVGGTTDITAGTTTLGTTGTTDFTVANIKGQVAGDVKSATTIDLGGQTQIDLVIGNQTFRGVVSETAAVGGIIEMRDINNSQNSFDLTTVGAALSTAAATQTDLRLTFNLSVAGASTVSFQSAVVDEAAAAALVNSTATTFAGAIGTSGTTKDQVYTLSSRYTAAVAATGAPESIEYRITGEDGISYSAILTDENTGTANNVLAAGTTKTLKFGNGIELTVDATAANARAAAADAGSLGFADARGVQFKVSAGTSTSLDFQVGANSSDLLTINFDSMTTASLGINGLSIETTAAAAIASDTIDLAINKVNSATASLGALQSRLEYIQSNLATITENVEAANGVFKDVDMAKEMTEFTKQQALSQAGVAMLSQANQMPQQLLRLLQ